MQVSYAIGVAEPTSIMVETFGTGKVSNETLDRTGPKHFDLRPKGIVNMLDLLRPIYQKTAAYGHFGRDEPEFSWEATDQGRFAGKKRRRRASTAKRAIRPVFSARATF